MEHEKIIELMIYYKSFTIDINNYRHVIRKNEGDNFNIYITTTVYGKTRCVINADISPSELINHLRGIGSGEIKIYDKVPHRLRSLLKGERNE